MKIKHAETIQVGIIGLGTIGGGVAKILKKKRKAILRQTGLDFNLKMVCDRDPKRKKLLHWGRTVFTRDLNQVLNDPQIDLVVELIGGTRLAFGIVEQSLKKAKDVISANKALFAERGIPLYRLSGRLGRSIGLEAAVCGGVPVIRGLREGLAANRISNIFGILNGTCNLILTEMSLNSRSYADVLKQAQREGFAERDPKLDVSGVDTAHKLAILARIAFQKEIDFSKISVEGIEDLTNRDIRFAQGMGYSVKLLAIGKKHRDGQIELRVHPTLLPKRHLLANVFGVNNGVLVRGDEVGDVLFYGKGAGERPTASAVVSDMIDIARGLRAGAKNREVVYPHAKIMLITEVISRYYLRLQVVDRAGVLGRLTGILGDCGVSISSVHQEETHGERSVPLIILTHQTREKNVRTALQKIARRRLMQQRPVVIRVEGEERAYA